MNISTALFILDPLWRRKLFFICMTSTTMSSRHFLDFMKPATFVSNVANHITTRKGTNAITLVIAVEKFMWKTEPGCIAQTAIGTTKVTRATIYTRKKPRPVTQHANLFTAVMCAIKLSIGISGTMNTYVTKRIATFVRDILLRITSVSCNELKLNIRKNKCTSSLTLSVLRIHFTSAVADTNQKTESAATVANPGVVQVSTYPICAWCRKYATYA